MESKLTRRLAEESAGAPFGIEAASTAGRRAIHLCAAVSAAPPSAQTFAALMCSRARLRLRIVALRAEVCQMDQEYLQQGVRGSRGWGMGWLETARIAGAPQSQASAGPSGKPPVAVRIDEGCVIA